MKVPLQTNSQMRLPRPIHLPLTISWTNYWRPDSLAVKGNKTRSVGFSILLLSYST